MQYPVIDVGRGGIVSDFLTANVPLNGWTGGNNVRFTDDSVSKSKGWASVLTPAPVAPLTLFSSGEGSLTKLVLCGATKVHAHFGGGYSDISRVSPVYSPTTRRWSGGLLGGVLVLNNGLNIPQYWAQPGIGVLANAPNFPPGISCRLLRPFGSYIVMADITEDNVRFPERVRWSAAASPGLMPDDYDVLSNTNDANEIELPSSGQAVLEMLGLGDTIIVYKRSSIWALPPSSSPLSAFSRRQVLDEIGIYAQDCVVNIRDNQQHLLFTGNDLLTFNGRETESVLENRTRNRLVGDIAKSDDGRAFLTSFPVQKEVMLAYPSKASGYCDKGLVWSWRTGATTFIDLPNILHAIRAQVELPTVESWDEQELSWNETNETWDTSSVLLGAVSSVAAAPGDQKVYLLNTGADADGAPYRAFVERQGINFAILTKNERLWQQRAQLNAIWPHAEGSAFNVHYGTQESIAGPITWETPKLFTPGVDQKVDCFVSGRFLAVRFESEDTGSWSLKGYGLDIEPCGYY